MRVCVAAFIVRDKKVLLGKRSAERKFYPNIWDVFGGHQNENESHEETLNRELYEELGILPTNWKFLLTVEEPDAVKNGDGLYHFYLVTDFTGEPQNLQLDEHATIEWFDFETAVKLPFADVRYADIIEYCFHSEGK